MPRYNPAQVEPKWQSRWQEHRTFRAPDLPGKKKLYALDMFPYPSGEGLHVGHPEGYTATDIVCRYHRMQGYSVLHPMGFDAFGLPAEEHAIKTNTPPRLQTEKNIDNFRRQLKMLGFSYDWDRELATTDVAYFRWTQFIFLLLFDTWYDTDQQVGRPIGELPIPEEVRVLGSRAISEYQDDFRLAYRSNALVNWCPNLGTVLANEEVVDGKSERGGHPVKRIPMRQWMLRITDYADRLDRDLEDLDWSNGIKKLQHDWIGRSTGAEVDFCVGTLEDYASWSDDRKQHGFPRKPNEGMLRVYTTRPDTLFGATYMVIAPEHPLAESLSSPEQLSSVREYCEQAAGKSDLERSELSKAKTGVFTGSYAINPVNQQSIPIWIADYVLVSYGTGAIMAVPGQDERDWEFAEVFGLPILRTVQPPSGFDGKAFTGCGPAINSQFLDGLPIDEAKETIIAWLSERGLGQAKVNYKLRDWLFSRQRFWGEPFPILHELDELGEPTGVVRGVDPQDLPVNLPHLEDYKPHGRPEPPLAKADDSWLYVIQDGKRYRRETNTMPQWAGSCWYYLRFIDPDNPDQLVDPVKERAWMPVDLYVGGAEHAVLHLLYARFWHKVLYDRGYVSTKEPFQRLVNQGMILGEVEYTGFARDDGNYVCATTVIRDENGQYAERSTNARVEATLLPPDEVVKQGDHFVLKQDPKVRVDSRAHKMSKSRGNVVNPDEIVRHYGADALRLYEMFMGPLEATKPWSMTGVGGVKGFLDRAWRMIVNEDAEEPDLNPAVNQEQPSEEQLRLLHKTIKAVTNNLESMSFNTAIARLMEFVNFFTKQTTRPISAMRTFVLLLSPMAPHICEELWSILGGTQSLAYEPWPQFDESLTIDAMVEIPVQIGGKVRAKITVPAGMSQSDLQAAAVANAKVQEILEGRPIKKAIVVPGRLVNFVI